MRLIIFIFTLLSASFPKDHEISSCICDHACYTDEVANLKCDPKVASFKSGGLPDASHTVMEGIIATNQQFPRVHQYEFKIKQVIS